MGVTKKVYIDWGYSGTGAADFSQAIDNISAYVKKVSIKQLGGVDINNRVANIGTCSLDLNNDNDRFMFNNPNSPLYQLYKPELPFKVVAVKSDGTEYTRFYGFTGDLITEGGVSYDGSIKAVNWLGLLQNTFPATPVLEDYTTDELISIVTGYALRGTIASNYLIFDKPTSVDNSGTVVVDGITYTADATPAAPYEFDKASSVYLQSQRDLDNLAKAINISGIAGTDYSSDIVQHPTVTATVPESSIFRGMILSEEPESETLNTEIINIAGDAAIVADTQSFRRSIAANGDTWAIDFYTPLATTYKFRTDFFKDSGSGILKIYIDDVLISTTDLYDAAGVLSSVTSSVVLTVGTHRIKYKIDGKNASSSGYRFLVNKNDSSGFSIITGIIQFESRIPSTLGNAYTLSRTGDFATYSTIGGATFSGATNEPVGFVDLQTGKVTVDLAGDNWGAGINAVHALTDIAKSELGWLFVQMNGALTFKNKEYFQKLQTATVVAHINNKTVTSGLRSRDVYNRVMISFRPRSSLVSGRLAQADQTYIVKPQTGVARTNANDPIPTDKDATFFILPAIDPTTKQSVGIESMVPLVGGTHYVAGVHGMYNSDPKVQVYVAINGNNFEVSIVNKRKDSVGIVNLYIDGVGLVHYNPITIALDSDDSTGVSIKPIKVDFPFTTDSNIAQAYMEYLIERHALIEYNIETVDLGVNEYVDGVHVLDLDIADVIKISEDRLHIDEQLYIITGIEHDLETPDTIRTKLYVWPVPPYNFFILEHATYGKIDSDNVLGY